MIKRDIYRYAGKDYERHERITITFNVQRVSIQNFLNLIIRTGYRDIMKIYIGDYFHDSVRTTVDNRMKEVRITTFADVMFSAVLEKLGFKEWHDVESPLIFNIRHRSLRAVHHFRYVPPVVYSCFDPKTKEIRYRSGTPIALNARQRVINGKLWRRQWDD